tara:strand:- start:9 stop:584 length:576 start_codon:yes stop_codon:yes gene_type:complete
MAVDFRAAESEFVSQDFDVAQDYKANELGTVAKFRDVGDTDLGSAFFKYVQYEQGAGAVAGVATKVAYYYKFDGFKTHQVSMDASDSIIGAATIMMGAGVMHSAPTDGQYLWIQVTGLATLASGMIADGGGSAVAPADGAALTPVSTDALVDGSLATVDIASIALSTIASNAVCAYADDESEETIVCAFPF